MLSVMFLCFACLQPPDLPIGDEPVIRFPLVPHQIEPGPGPRPTPPPQVVESFAADEWYVIESNVPLIMWQTPDEIVDVTPDVGPLKLRGKFADGLISNGVRVIESRTYEAEYLYLITSPHAGVTEIAVIPQGVTDAAAITRLPITVTGEGPRPPPDPEPDPDDPDPPQPVVNSFRVIFVKESGATLNADQSAIPGAKAIRDYLNAKTTPEDGLAGWREFDPQFSAEFEQPTMKALWLAVKPKVQTVPCMVVEVNGHATVMPFPANVAACMVTLKKHGGE